MKTKKLSFIKTLEKEWLANIRKYVVERDGGLCRLCGKGGSDVHHIYGRRCNSMDYMDGICSVCNLKGREGVRKHYLNPDWQVLLCKGCHFKEKVGSPTTKYNFFKSCFEQAKINEKRSKK